MSDGAQRAAVYVDDLSLAFHVDYYSNQISFDF